MHALMLASVLLIASPLTEARAFEAHLRADDAKMRVRQNLEHLVELWAKAKKEDRRAAIEGEARAWKLLAHWSGRADDRAKADAKADEATKRDAKERKMPAPPEMKKNKSMLARVSVEEGARLHLSINGPFTSKRDQIPAHGGQGVRVFFDLAPVIVAKEALGEVKVEREGIARVRIGQFDDDTARVVIDLAPGAGIEKAIAVEGDAIALGPTLAPAPETPKEIASVTPDLRAIVEELKRTMPAPRRAREEAVEEEDDEAPVEHVAKVEAPLDDATMKALKRSTREAVQPRDDRFVSIRRVVIDAGHGGKDQGARGAGGVLEKDVNLAVAMKLGAELKRKLGVKVIFTRSTDDFVTLERRSQLANNSDADLFISIHANAHHNRSVHGIETYYLNTTSDHYAARLARRENGGGDDSGEEPEPGVGDGERDHEDASLPPGALGRDLRLLLADLAMRSASAESKRLAGHVQSSCVGVLRRKHDEISDLGVKHALFYVLIGARMPSILVETGFVTNATEGKRLADGEYQSEVAAAIAQGIARWVAERDAIADRADTRNQTLASSR